MSTKPVACHVPKIGTEIGTYLLILDVSIFESTICNHIKLNGCHPLMKELTCARNCDYP